MAGLLLLILLVFAAPAVWPSDTVASIAWTKRFGGSSADFAGGMARDAAGNIYLTGTTESIDLPANGVFRTPRDSNLYRVDLQRGAAEAYVRPSIQILATAATRRAGGSYSLPVIPGEDLGGWPVAAVLDGVPAALVDPRYCRGRGR